ncbi:hypothetical protein Salmuc_00805 [Salipiger mucosus DSM 16094]|uniref:Uncharacterized protein n=1 Tax=Salipiger mucosus DSM 16094 TaxID=1123237 RepID=S9SI27_9RHOB|nr:hypothetical protein Salmuc_00805 [Salipiger mucosus DSM 16094]
MGLSTRCRFGQGFSRHQCVGRPVLLPVIRSHHRNCPRQAPVPLPQRGAG